MATQSATRQFVLTISDRRNTATASGRGGASFTIVCQTSKASQEEVYAHIARNWRTEWGRLPSSRAAAIKLYFITDGSGPVTMPSGESYTPVATYTSTPTPFSDEARATKMATQAARQHIGNGRTTSQRAGVGSR